MKLEPYARRCEIDTQLAATRRVSLRHQNRGCGPCVPTDDVQTPGPSRGKTRRTADLMADRLTDVALPGVEDPYRVRTSIQGNVSGLRRPLGELPALSSEEEERF